MLSNGMDINTEREDETYPASAPSSTVSLESYVCDYEEENGRSYHSYKAGRYWGPNDAAARDHEKLGHDLYFKTFQRHFLCPLGNKPERILDLGTGTGIWAQAVADVCSNALVTGIDLSPIQTTWVSPNLRFVVDDIEQELPYADNTFDLIHIRGLDGSVRDWPRLFARALRCLKPGGYLEHAEYSVIFTCSDDSIPTDSAIAQWNRLMLQSHQTSGTEIHAILRTEDRMKSVGFEDVVSVYCPWPIRDWAKQSIYQQLGTLARDHVSAGLENWCMRRFTRDTSWDREEVIVLCAELRREIATRGIHAIQEVKVVYGRKPC